MTAEFVTPPPAPSFLSEAARAGLEQPIVPTQYPGAGRPGRLGAVGGPDGRDGRRDAERHAAARGLRTPRHRRCPDLRAHPEECRVGDDAPVYLTIHGGALVMGGGDLTRVMTEFNVAVTGILNWAPDYRMPPAHPYPAALDDAIAVYRALLEVRDPSQIVVGGGSAGGNLAAALLLRAKDEGLPMPAALVLLTPEIDLTESGDSFTTLAHVSVGLQTLRDVNLLYAGGHDLTDPYLSPLFGDLTGFPPTLLIGGTRDLFLSNTVRMHRKLREAGVDADLHIFDARPHAGYGNAPEEAAVSAEQAAFVRRHLGLQQSASRREINGLTNNERPRTIAALGSSFAAGPTIEPVDDVDAMRSTRNYPHLLAADARCRPRRPDRLRRHHGEHPHHAANDDDRPGIRPADRRPARRRRPGDHHRGRQ